MSQREVVIVGGGLIGLTSALELADRGHRVTVVDSAALGSGAARGNAGFFSPVLMAPLAGPGQVATAVRSLFNPLSPLRIRPQALPSMTRWGLTFLRHCNAGAFRRGQEALAALNSGMQARLDRLRALGVAIDLTPEIVVPFEDVAFAERFFEDCVAMRRFGLAVPDRIVDGDELRRLVPALTAKVRAGFALPGNRAADPRAYADSLIALLRARSDVALIEHRQITGFDHGGGRVRAVLTDAGRVEADEVILAAGAGIGAIGRMLDVRIPVIGGQGYNVALPVSDGLKHPVIVEEVHAVATPFADRIRLGGTMEFAGATPTFDQRRVDAVLRSMRPYFDLDWDAAHDTWAGSRPMSDDGLPIIGRPRAYSNVVVAGGHGMYGLTLAPATAVAVADLVTVGHTDTDLTPFTVER